MSRRCRERGSRCGSAALVAGTPWLCASPSPHPTPPHSLELQVLGDAVLNHRCAQRQDESGTWNLYGGRLDWDQRAIVGERQWGGARAARGQRGWNKAGRLWATAGQPPAARCHARLACTRPLLPAQVMTTASAAAATGQAATSSKRRPTSTTARSLSRWGWVVHCRARVERRSSSVLCSVAHLLA